MWLHCESARSVFSHAGGGEDAYDQCCRLYSIFPILLTAVYRSGAIQLYKGVQPDSDDPYKCGSKCQSAVVVSDRNVCDPAGATCDGDVYGAFHRAIAAHLPELPAVWGSKVKMIGIKSFYILRRVYICNIISANNFIDLLKENIGGEDMIETTFGNSSLEEVTRNKDERHATEEKLQQALKEAQDARDELMLDHEIISAVSKLYFSIYRIDLLNDFYEEISSDKTVHRLTGHEGKAQKKMYELCDSIVSEKYKNAVRRFFDLSTVSDRLEDTDTVEMEYLSTDGNWHQARFIDKKRDENGRVTHILYVTRIVSQEKKKELENQRLEVAYKVAESANEAKTRFLLNMSHDIRTPMNAIIGYSQLMRKKLTDPELIHYQQMIEESGNILLSIINNVLDMARIESGKMVLDENYNEVGSIVGKICQVYQEEADKKGIQIVYKESAENLHILCDITKIEEIFTNLISNAIKYTPEGGKIYVSKEVVPCEKDGYIGIKTIVEDTGIGISKDFLPHIFEPFERERNTTVSKVTGTGLGLPIVKKLVELMGGTIEVKSELGKGSRFTVVIPHKLVDEKMYEKKAGCPARDTEDVFEGKNILLAEDNDLNAEIATAILEEMGFTVDRVDDGVLCVNKMEQQPAGTYDAILMDIQMPNMDGYKATQTIRQLSDPEKADIPIVAMTANAFEEDRKKAFEMGMNGHIAKPIDVENIRKTLAPLLRAE